MHVILFMLIPVYIYLYNHKIVSGIICGDRSIYLVMDVILLNSDPRHSISRTGGFDWGWPEGYPDIMCVHCKLNSFDYFIILNRVPEWKGREVWLTIIVMCLLWFCGVCVPAELWWRMALGFWFPILACRLRGIGINGYVVVVYILAWADWQHLFYAVKHRWSRWDFWFGFSWIQEMIIHHQEYWI